MKWQARKNQRLLARICKSEIKLTESLAASLVESTRRQYEQRIADKEAEVSRREAAIAKGQATIDNQMATKLETERAIIVAAEAKKARDAVADEIALGLLEERGA